MRLFRTGVAGMMAVCFLGIAYQVRAQKDPKLTKADIDRWMTELSNWGRWGKEDELGAMNLITPAKRKQAAALVKEGVSVSLSRSTEKEKAVDVQSPFGHVMNQSGLKNPGA